MSGNVVDPDLVYAYRGNHNLADVGRNVRGQVSGGIVYFVQQLFFDGLLGDYPSGVRGLPDGKAARRLDISNGNPQIVHAGHILDARDCEVPASDLRTAFQQVACDRGATQTVPVVVLPSEMGHGRADYQRGVGNASRHDDIGAFPQRLCNFLGTLVSVDADDIELIEAAS